MLCELFLSVSALTWPFLTGLGQNLGVASAEAVAPSGQVGVGLGLTPSTNPTPQDQLMAKRAAEIRALRNALIGQVDQLCDVASGTAAPGGQPVANAPAAPAASASGPAAQPAAPAPGKTVRQVSIQTSIIRTRGAVPALPQPTVVKSPITCGRVKVDGQTGSFRVLETTQLASGAYQARVVVNLPQPVTLNASQQSAVIEAVQNRVAGALEERAQMEQNLADLKAEMIAVERHLAHLAAQRADLEARLGAAPAAPVAPASQPASH